MEKTLGMRIGEYRRAKGMKQDELAEALGVSPQAVSKWENDVSCPDIMTLPKLAKLLGVSVDVLLSGENETEPEAKYLPPEERKCFDQMMLRVKVDTWDEDKAKVRINLPLPLVKVFLESGGSVENLTGGAVKGGIDMAQIMQMVENGVIGKLMEVDAEDCHVEIMVE